MSIYCHLVEKREIDYLFIYFVCQVNHLNQMQVILQNA